MPFIITNFDFMVVSDTVLDMINAVDFNFY